jgi:hypothetical protein
VFDLIRHKRHGDAAVLWAFDLIELDGDDLRRSSIEYRKRKLGKLLRAPHLGIVLNEQLGRTMESILSKLKPEAAYFTPLEGKRGGMIFFDLADPSQIVETVEPFFLGLNATTELVPVMNADDLRKGLAKVAGK